MSPYHLTATGPAGDQIISADLAERPRGAGSPVNAVEALFPALAVLPAYQVRIADADGHWYGWDVNGVTVRLRQEGDR